MASSSSFLFLFLLWISFLFLRPHSDQDRLFSIFTPKLTSNTDFVMELWGKKCSDCSKPLTQIFCFLQVHSQLLISLIITKYILSEKISGIYLMHTLMQNRLLIIFLSGNPVLKLFNLISLLSSPFFSPSVKTTVMNSQKCSLRQSSLFLFFILTVQM